MADPFTWALIIAGTATVYSIEEQRSAQRAQERAEKVNQRRADVATQRERVKQIRQGRFNRAAALAQSTTGEGTGGSGLLGITQNIQAQVGSNLKFLDQEQQFSTEISNLNTEISAHSTNASTGAAVAGVATNYASLFKKD